jgi:hypothetical protein
MRQLPTDEELIRIAAERKGRKAADSTAHLLATMKRVSDKANLTGDEALELAVREQHAMRAARKASRATP